MPILSQFLRSPSDSSDSDNAAGAANGRGRIPSDGTHDFGSDIIKKRKAVYYRAKEIYTTEHTYVEDLNLLHIDFRQAVKDAGGAKVIPDDDLGKIFGNLKELLTFNSDLLGDLRSRIEGWESRREIADIFVKKGPFLQLYSTYMSNHQDAMSHLSQCRKKYPGFGAVVKEFQSRKALKGLEIEHYFLTPVQRLMRYKIMLEAYLKALSKDAADYESAMKALSIVTEVANRANKHMTINVRIVM